MHRTSASLISILWSWAVSEHIIPSFMDADHTYYIIFRQLLGFSTGTKLYTVWQQRQTGANNLTVVITHQCPNWNRTLNLTFYCDFHSSPSKRAPWSYLRKHLISAKMQTVKFTTRDATAYFFGPLCSLLIDKYSYTGVRTRGSRIIVSNPSVRPILVLSVVSWQNRFSWRRKLQRRKPIPSLQVPINTAA